MAAWSLLAFEAAEAVDAVVIAAPPQAVAELARLAADVTPGLPALVVPGGDSRSESVARALAETPEDVEVVAVHDAARPLVTAELLDRCVSQLERWGCDGVVAGARTVDTIKEADAGGRVLATLERERLWAVQTPQAFRARSLARALADGDLERAYDDAQLVEAAGGDVRIVEAPRQNLKVTTAHDLSVATLLLSPGP
jgi:2-C-methyl-D-erythritol 4-phosphate cytidylyltransferase